jgi:hypothetical protein
LYPWLTETETEPESLLAEPGFTMESFRSALQSTQRLRASRRPATMMMTNSTRVGPSPPPETGSCTIAGHGYRVGI